MATGLWLYLSHKLLGKIVGSRHLRYYSEFFEPPQLTLSLHFELILVPVGLYCKLVYATHTCETCLFVTTIALLCLGTIWFDSVELSNLPQKFANSQYVPTGQLINIVRQL